MSNKLATILMTSPRAGFGLGAQEYLLQEYNCSLGNNLSAALTNPRFSKEYPDAKHIVPMFGYPESWGRIQRTWEEWYGHIPNGNVYYYNCGAGDWNGLDEPGTRGDRYLREINYGRALQMVEDTRQLMPGLKTVVTHPFPTGFECDRIESDVWGWRLRYLVAGGDDFRYKWAIPPDKEVWAYLIDEDLNDRDLADTGKICRDLGLSACLIYKAEHPALWDADAKRMTAKGKALLEGMVAA